LPHTKCFSIEPESGFDIGGAFSTMALTGKYWHFQDWVILLPANDIELQVD
jgi:hypothetical protein